MININRGLIPALACVGLVIATPTAAIAQTEAVAEVQTSNACQTQPNDSATGSAFFGVEEKVAGLMFNCNDWIQLRNKGVLVKEPFLRSELQAVASKHGWASRKMLAALDKYSKEGTSIQVYRYDGGLGVTLVENLKGTDIAANCFRMAGWTLAGNSDGKHLYQHIVCGENWQTIFAKTASTALGTAFASSTAAAVANATAPSRGGDKFFIQGGSAIAATSSNAQTLVKTNTAVAVSTAVSAGPARCAPADDTCD